MCGLCGQKEHLIFHSQPNLCIFDTFHVKNEFHIHWGDRHLLKYIQLCTQEPFSIHQSDGSKFYRLSNISEPSSQRISRCTLMIKFKIDIIIIYIFKVKMCLIDYF